jgi:hypothetical protein
MFNISERNFDATLDELKKEYHSVVASNKRLIDELNQYNKDVVIQKLSQQLYNQQRRCLHDLIGDEKDKYYTFRRKHYEKCKNSNHYIVELIGTGLSESITVKCPNCGESEDITEYSMW